VRGACAGQGEGTCDSLEGTSPRPSSTSEPLFGAAGLRPSRSRCCGHRPGEEPRIAGGARLGAFLLTWNHGTQNMPLCADVGKAISSHGSQDVGRCHSYAAPVRSSALMGGPTGCRGTPFGPLLTVSVRCRGAADGRSASPEVRAAEPRRGHHRQPFSVAPPCPPRRSVCCSPHSCKL